VHRGEKIVQPIPSHGGLDRGNILWSEIGKILNEVMRDVLDLSVFDDCAAVIDGSQVGCELVQIDTGIIHDTSKR